MVIHNYILIGLMAFIATVLSIIRFSGPVEEIPYAVLAMSMISTGWVSIRLIMTSPTERFNPLTLLAIVYPIQFTGTVLLTKWHKIVSWKELTQHYYGINATNIMDALMLVYIFSLGAALMGLLLASSRAWNELQVSANRLLEGKNQFLNGFTLLIVALELYLIASGKVTIQGESLLGKDLENLTVHPLVALVGPVSGVAVFFTVTRLKEERTWWLIALIIVQFIWFFLWGRRQLVFFGYLAFVALFVGQVIRVSWPTVRSLGRFAMLALLFTVLSTAAGFYQQVREVGGAKLLQQTNAENLGRLVSLYTRADGERLRSATRFNVEIRALSTVAAVAYYTKLIRYQSAEAAGGIEFWNSVLKSTPSSYFVDKASIQVMEGHAAELTNGAISRRWDMGGSLVFEGLIDFHFWGIIVYPVILLILVWAVLSWMAFQRNGVLAVLSLVMLSHTALALSEGGWGDLMIAIRALLTVWLIAFLLSVMKGEIRRYRQERVNRGSENLVLNR